MLQNLEFIQGFVEEARTHVEVVEAELLKMDVNVMDTESINNVFRAVHSVKGTAGFFNLSVIVRLSHTMENIFGEVRSGKMRLTGAMVDCLLAANDCLKAMIEDVMESENKDISDIEEKLKDIVAPGGKKSGEDGAKVADPGEARKEILDADIKRGYFPYEFTLQLEGDLMKQGGPVQFAKKIREVGNIISCTADIGSDDTAFTFHVTSVLETELFSEALGIPADRIGRLQYETRQETPASGSGRQDTVAVVKEPDREEPEKETHTEGQREAGPEKSQGIAVEDSVRVHVTLLNNLLNLASEMVLGRNQLLRAMEKHRKVISGIDPILQNVDHITTELQEKIMQTRMQPIANVFNKFPRIIRDLSKKLQKEISLRLEGVDVELDKSIIEALADPLTHLVRNAADHGLEKPDAREKAGKARTGNIVMQAYHEGGYVNIDVTDDGRGIDIESVRKKAVERVLVNKADAAVMNEQEILQLLFMPGFSTADKITDVSGRGVGMDVVKTNIEKLGGTVEIFTAPGKGTTFRLLLPLTLAIISSLIVEVEGQKFALPQVNLQEIVRIKPGDRAKRIEYINNAEVLRLRGKLLPIVHLADVIGLKRTYFDTMTGERKEDRRKTLSDSRRAIDDEDVQDTPVGPGEYRRLEISNILRILVVKIGSRKLGIAVNSIHESEEILVKPLPVHIKECKCYSGVTILGDGKTVMILDPSGIIDKANLHFSEGQDEKKTTAQAEEEERIREQQDILLFRCSGPETLAVDISMVQRVEEIEAGSIEHIGDKEYIKFRGDVLRVIRPEDFLPITKNRNSRNKLFVIIPKLVTQKIGILIESIVDTVQSEISLKPGGIKGKGIVGSAILSDRIVLLLNIYELFEQADPEYFAVKNCVKPGDRITVLLAEDTPFFQKLEKDYLEGAGYHVLAVQNGKEALQALQENNIDIVVSDINMPVMDGLELAGRIRGNAQYKDLPLIALTSLTAESHVKKGMEAGYDAYEFKLDRARLLDVIEQKMRKRGKVK